MNKSIRVVVRVQGADAFEFSGYAIPRAKDIVTAPEGERYVVLEACWVTHRDALGCYATTVVPDCVPDNRRNG